MAKRTQRRNPASTTNGARTRTSQPDLRERILADFATLKVPLSAAQLDAVLARAERERMSHLEVVHRLIAEQAQQRRERAIARRIKEACFRDAYTLADFDWEFNAKAINRVQIEELATGAFIGRQDNLVMVGQSGVGKSRIVESVGRAACVVGYRVRYTTSADLLTDLTARLADHTLPKHLRYYARFDWLIIDEFAFDKIERNETSQAANLLYKIIDGRRQRSTTVVTNIDFDAWGTYLDDPPLAMAFLDRVVDGAIIIKINGRSYRAHRRHEEDDRNQVTPTCPATIIPSTWIARIHRQAPVPSSLSHRDIGLLFDRDQQWWPVCTSCVITKQKPPRFGRSCTPSSPRWVRRS